MKKKNAANGVRIRIVFALLFFFFHMVCDFTRSVRWFVFLFAIDSP